MCLAIRDDPGDKSIRAAFKMLMSTRPTAVNLLWALNQLLSAVSPLSPEKRLEHAWRKAAEICDKDVAVNEAIGRHGLEIFREILNKKKAAQGRQARLNVLTHCNAGWLACVDWGTALAPIFMAHDAGLLIHVWVDETRPRNQGASLTAWELNQHGVPHTVIVDNAGGHLMQHGLVDLVIVGADRATAQGDVANKIGTYLKALAARDNDVPFYVALPGSTIDWTIRDGLKEIPIEERSAAEVTHLRGKTADGSLAEIQVTPDGSPAGNYGFDVTPARLVTALITEKGVCAAGEAGLKKLFGS
jgi:methylthioribose-1-phosphate isomerase